MELKGDSSEAAWIVYWCRARPIEARDGFAESAGVVAAVNAGDDIGVPDTDAVTLGVAMLGD